VSNYLPERVGMSKSVGDFRHQVNKLDFCDYCGNGMHITFFTQYKQFDKQFVHFVFLEAHVSAVGL